jgi:hypothetical protein
MMANNSLLNTRCQPERAFTKPIKSAMKVASEVFKSAAKVYLAPLEFTGQNAKVELSPPERRKP